MITIKQEDEKWTVAKKIKVMNAISKVYSEATEKYTRGKYTQLKKVFACDPTMVSLIKPLTEQAKDILFDFVEKTAEYPKMDLSYIPEKLEESRSKFSLEFLLPTLNIMKASGEESVILYVKKDYPITLENENFRIVIAPRVED